MIGKNNKQPNTTDSKMDLVVPITDPELVARMLDTSWLYCTIETLKSNREVTPTLIAILTSLFKDMESQFFCRLREHLGLKPDQMVRVITDKTSGICAVIMRRKAQSGNHGRSNPSFN